MDDDLWPLDTQECASLGRAIHRIGSAMLPAVWTGMEQTASDEASLKRLDEVRSITANAIQAGELELRVRIVGATENRLGIINSSLRTPEGWIEAIQTYQIEELDFRPWISIRQRRRISQPHWLFATRASLAGVLKEFATTPQRRAVKQAIQSLGYEELERHRDKVRYAKIIEEVTKHGITVAQTTVGEIWREDKSRRNRD